MTDSNDSRTSLLRKRLQLLQQQLLQLGNYAPSYLIMEIEDLEREIYRFESTVVSSEMEIAYPSNYDAKQTLERRRRLQILKKQQAEFGLHTPPHITMEIEDLEREIEESELDVATKTPVYLNEQREYNRDLYNTYKRQLLILERQVAILGISTPPSITAEIEDLRHKLTELVPELEYVPLLGERIAVISGLLDLSFKQLKHVPDEVFQMNDVKTLDLSFNRITKLPRELFLMKGLETINLRSNQLTRIPPDIAMLSSLVSINVRNNRILAIPEELVELPNLTSIDLRGNLLSIPPEILEQKDKIVNIITYYRTHRGISQEKSPLNEAKMLIVGEGEVGKTSLMKRMLDKEFDPNETKTEGINIQKYRMTFDDAESDEAEIWLNMWDFGGQEIMHSTHQFFLTKRSVYLLVLDARRGEQESRVEYWLKLITSFGGNSPVIVVCNKSDEHQMEMDWTGLQKKYPSIEVFVKRVSSKTGEGIDELLNKIKRIVRQLNHVHDPLLISWLTVKTHLEEMERDYISYQDYQKLCQEQGIIDEASQNTLIEFLNDLGVILHFGDHPILEDTNVLNPEWVTKGVYEILNSYELAQSKGVLERKTLNRILKSPLYPRAKHLFIIDIMRKFELCFDFEGKANEKFLIPDLLQKDEPDTGDWSDSLGFEYHYDVLPGSIVSRFIVRMHTYISKNTYWRNGVVLISEDGNNKALVKSDIEDAKIFIKVSGRDSTRRRFLEIIRAELRSIHGTIPEIKVKQKVPLPLHPGIVTDYEHLLNLEMLGEETFVPEGLHEKINVAELLNGVDIRRQTAKPQSIITNNKISDLRRLDILYQNLGDLQEQKALYGIDVPIKLINAIRLTITEIKEIEDAMKK